MLLALALTMFACSTEEVEGKYSDTAAPTMDNPVRDSGEPTETGDTGEPTETGDTGESTETGDTAPPPTLYEQLGGEAAVAAVVDAFVAQVAADANINWFFAETDIPNLKAKLNEQICSATGGPCTYTGGSMVDVHAGMAITDAQFDALVGDLLLALDSLGIPYALDGTATIDPLLLALVGMKSDIVTDADGSAVLFNQIGGHAAVEAVIGEFLTVVAADARINWFFADADLVALNDNLIDQVCSAGGGYCTYSGGDMVTVHAGMAITNYQFDALVGDLLVALDTLGVPYALDGTEAIDPLLAALLAMQPDIVTDADGSGVYFNQLGGYAGVEAVVAEFVGVVAGDARINTFFASTDIARLSGLLVEQICDETGGYCTYSGLSMLDAHTGMGVTEDDFNALVEDLMTAMTTLGVPYSSALDGSALGDTLLLTLAGMQSDIVGH